MTKTRIMSSLIFFILLSIPVIIFSRRNLFKPASHGFYRFWSWECIILLFSYNYPNWFTNPFSIIQIISWVFLILSVYLVLSGVITLRSGGKSSKTREDKNLYQFEQTTELVESGIYRFIRHPMYASLLFLTWGIWLKNPSFVLLIVSLLSAIMLYITARMDEKECILFFGDKYVHYMSKNEKIHSISFLKKEIINCIITCPPNGIRLPSMSVSVISRPVSGIVSIGCCIHPDCVN